MDKYIKQFSSCIQHEIPFCSAACPFKLDVVSFISRLQEGRFSAAYRLLRDATGFPAIASQLCEGFCKAACFENAVSGGDAIDLPALEKACIAHVKRKAPTKYNLPKKKKSIAIVGAGISSMACALRLASKNYKVVIFEKTHRIGGALWNLMEPQVFQEEFTLQMQHLDYTLLLNHEVHSLEELLQYNGQ